METGSLILILSFVIPLIVIIIILLSIKKGFKKQVQFSKELNKRISASRPATAVIISANQGMTGGDIHRIIHLNLQISDGYGPAYNAGVTWFVNTLHFDKIREGNSIKVKVDAENKNTIYPSESWAKYSQGYENL